MTKSHFKTFLKTESGKMAASLLVKHKMSLEDMFVVIHDYVAAIIPTLIPEKKYTLEKLVGPELWDEWPYKGMVRPAGMCLKYLVLAEVLPLELLNDPRDSSMKLYRLRFKEAMVAV